MANTENDHAPFVLFEYDHRPGTFCLMLSDTHMVVGGVDAVFEQSGRYGNGYGWADVALGVIRTRAPELERRLDMDPEAGTFVAYGKDLEALKHLASLLHAAYHDHQRLAALVRTAPYEYD